MRMASPARHATAAHCRTLPPSDARDCPAPNSALPKMLAMLPVGVGLTAMRVSKRECSFAAKLGTSRRGAQRHVERMMSRMPGPRDVRHRRLSNGAFVPAPARRPPHVRKGSSPCSLCRNFGDLRRPRRPTHRGSNIGPNPHATIPFRKNVRNERCHARASTRVSRRAYAPRNADLKSADSRPRCARRPGPPHKRSPPPACGALDSADFKNADDVTKLRVGRRGFAVPLGSFANGAAGFAIPSRAAECPTNGLPKCADSSVGPVAGRGRRCWAP